MDDTPTSNQRPDSAGSAFGRTGLASRSLSTLGLWATVIGIFVWGDPRGFALLIGGLGVLGTWEFHIIVRRAGVVPMGRFGMLGALAYTLALYALLLQGNEDATHLLDGMAISLFAGLAFFLHLGGAVDGQRPVISLALAILGFVYLAFGMNFTGRVVFFDYSGTGPPPGAWLALWLVAVTKFTDMGAYLVGTAIGKTKLIPHISPGKTREGLLGAVLFSQIAACGLYAGFPAHLAPLGGWVHVVVLGLVLAAAAVIGDLAESLLKRSLAIKDSGHSLPGIGGVLDLIDSVIFTAPILYFYLHWLHHPATS